MARPRTRSMVAASKAEATQTPADILDAMLARQAAAARAVRDNPEPDWDEGPELDATEDEDEHTDLVDDEWPVTEAQARAAYHFEEGDNGDL